MKLSKYEKKKKLAVHHICDNLLNSTVAHNLCFPPQLGKQYGWKDDTLNRFFYVARKTKIYVTNYSVCFLDQNHEKHNQF